MTDIPDAAIEAAADGLARYCPKPDAQGVRCHGCMEQARVAIEAAMPAIREAIAQEIESHVGYAKQYEPDSAFLVGLDTAVGLIRNPT